MQALQQPSVADYFALDTEDADVRHEYWDGHLIAMAGAELSHNLIKDNLGAALKERLRERGCLVVQSGQRVRVEATKYGYPDVVVVCGDLDLDRSRRPATLQNPGLLIEVTSPSTAERDLTDKAQAYLALPSVREYWVARADEPLVTQLVKRADGPFEVRFARGSEAVVQSESFRLEVPLADVYDAVWARVRDQEREAENTAE